MYESRHIAQLFVHSMIYIYILSRFLPNFVFIKENCRKNGYVLAKSHRFFLFCHCAQLFLQELVHILQNPSSFCLIPEEIREIQLQRWRQKQKLTSSGRCPHISAAASRIFCFPNIPPPPLGLLFVSVPLAAFFDFILNFCYNIYIKQRK